MSSNDASLELLTAPNTDNQTANAKLVYSGDGTLLFERIGPTVYVRQSSSGRILHECRPSHRSSVVSVGQHALNPLQLLCAYANGEICLWDYTEETILATYSVQCKELLWMGVSQHRPSIVYIAIAKEQNEKTRWNVLEYNLRKKKNSRSIVEHSKTTFTTADVQSVRIQQDDEAFEGDVLVITANDRVFGVLMDAEKPNGYRITKLQHTRNITTASVHPNALEFTVGDQQGQLCRYHLSTSGDNISVSTSTLHWHAHPVQAVVYSSDGQWLVSGGHECVVVRWHLSSGRRAYLPRRTAPITSLSTVRPRLVSSNDVDTIVSPGGHYAVSMSDHTIFQYDPVTKEVQWTAEALARAGGNVHQTCPWGTLVFDPVTSSVPLNAGSSQGRLQFYDPMTDHVLQTLPLTSRNQVSKTELADKMPQTVAELVAFSPKGTTLATLHSHWTETTSVHVDTDVEDMDGLGSSKPMEQCLVFWQRDSDGTFVPTTSIDAPHDSKVTSIAVGPVLSHQQDDCWMVTTDAKGVFKIWGQEMTKDKSRKWTCQSAVHYRELPITSCGVSPDGSILAVAYKQLVTLWDVQQLTLKHVITSADGTSVSSILFPGQTCPYMVLQSAESVQVWDLLTWTLHWSLTAPSSWDKSPAFGIQAHPKAPEFLLWTQTSNDDTVVCQFRPEVPTPTKKTSFTLPSGHAVSTLAFHPQQCDDYVILDSTSNAWKFGTSVRQTQEDEKSGSSNHLSQLFRPDSRKPSTSPTKTHVASNKAQELLQAPSHVLPSMSTLYQSFMDEIMPKPSSVVTSEQPKASKKRKHDKEKDSTKRMKQVAQKELADMNLQEQTYTTLVDTIRKQRQTKE